MRRDSTRTRDKTDGHKMKLKQKCRETLSSEIINPTVGEHN